MSQSSNHTPHPPSLHPAFDWHEIARLALLSRTLDRIEEKELYPAGHVVYQFSAIGHELGQLLLGQLLTHSLDAVGSYYRSRPLLFALGLTAEEALASGMGRSGGVSNGRDVGVVYNLPARGRATVLPAAGDVGNQYTPAAGWAQAIQYRVHHLGEQEHAGSIGVACGGDGSVAANGFWSAVTMATTLQLPLLFYIEDNGYAISVGSELQTPGGDICANLAAFGGLALASGDGTDPAEAAMLVAQAVAHVRAGGGPFLLRLRVPRLSGHSVMDNQAYKSAETRSAELARDPLPRLRDYLVPALFSADSWDTLAADTEAALRRALADVLEQPKADPAAITRYAFAVPDDPATVGWRTPADALADTTTRPEPPDNRRLNMVQAVQRTLDVELGRNPRLLVFGEDVGVKGGVHVATQGLQAAHGPQRVFDTSLSEEGIIGRSLGLAAAGLLPVPEIQFRKYADAAMEQLHNLGTVRWRTHNRFAAPVVVRTAGGFGRKLGDPWHSVTNEALFAHAVGWQVAFPSNAEDCVGLLRMALRSDNPTFFLEHRAQLDAAWARRPYPGDRFIVPFGRGRLLTDGDRLTVVTWGAMAERCEQAALGLESRWRGTVEVIDLRSLIPWDREMVLESVRKTGKCLVVHEDIGVAGFGAEVVATVVAEAFDFLDGPVQRVTAPAIPVPYDTALMQAVVPSLERISAAMRDLLGY
jgi:2-oxoisovalerate dehydrogenase E1 component